MNHKHDLKICHTCNHIYIDKKNMVECSTCQKPLAPFDLRIHELENIKTGQTFNIYVEAEFERIFQRYVITLARKLKANDELVKLLRAEIKRLNETIPPKLPKLKICKMCKREFFPRNPIRSQYCSDACRAKATREREKLKNEQKNTKV